MDQETSIKPVPNHVAIIMDGNGRWATSRGLPRTEGHRRGADAVKRTIEAAHELGIQHITLFGFSSENWLRPPEEVSDLMQLLRMFLKSKTAEYHKSGARLRVIGCRKRLADDIVKLIENAENLTAENTKIDVTVALSYGGRQDIVQAALRLSEDIASGVVNADEVDEQAFQPYLMTAGMPDPDLIIRTSGEYRISNFLLWQSAYSEFVSIDTLWPDFSKADLEYAVETYRGRERRFGLVPSSKVAGSKG